MASFSFSRLPRLESKLGRGGPIDSLQLSLASFTVGIDTESDYDTLSWPHAPPTHASWSAVSRGPSTCTSSRTLRWSIRRAPNSWYQHLFFKLNKVFFLISLTIQLLCLVFKMLKGVSMKSWSESGFTFSFPFFCPRSPGVVGDTVVSWGCRFFFSWHQGVIKISLFSGRTEGANCLTES